VRPHARLFAIFEPGASTVLPRCDLGVKRLPVRDLEVVTSRSPNEFRSDDIEAERFSDSSLSTVVAQCYVRLSTHCAREAGGSNGAPKTQVVLAILPDRTSMMLMTCQVTPSGYLAVPKNV